MNKYVVLYSGGRSSSECALTVAKKYGAENVILLNHDINPHVEQDCTKKLKDDVADYLGLEVTYANHKDWNVATPISVCVDASAWKIAQGGKIGDVLCTSRLKTEPFTRWLKENDPDHENIYVYGFDASEPTRITRRSQIMGQMGYKTIFPMIWDRKDRVTLEDATIEAGSIYERFKHSNCTGCLKAGWQHWYIVFCTRPDIWEEAKLAEDKIGFAIHKDKDGAVYLEDKEEMFTKMKEAGLEPNEHIVFQTFWAKARKAIRDYDAEMKALEEHDDGVCLDCMG